MRCLASRRGRVAAGGSGGGGGEQPGILAGRAAISGAVQAAYLGLGRGRAAAAAGCAWGRRSGVPQNAETVAMADAVQTGSE